MEINYRDYELFTKIYELMDRIDAKARELDLLSEEVGTLCDYVLPKNETAKDFILLEYHPKESIDWNIKHLEEQTGVIVCRNPTCNQLPALEII